MGKITGFIEYKRKDPRKEAITKRIKHFKEFEFPLPPDEIEKQAARCMDCGIPHCHSYGCPTENLIPEWNDLVYHNQWKQALKVLLSTDNFPEFTGRVCPAPCEAACTLSINQPAVTIRNIELQIIEKGWKMGWVIPEPAPYKTGKKVAVVGSGPAGLAAAQQLCRQGHQVIVFERSDRIGGLLRYGIPDFKLEKWIIDRRLDQMKKEGVIFESSVEAGVDLSLKYMQRSFDAIVLATGATIPRDLNIPGRELDGIHMAMDFLSQQNKINAGDTIVNQKKIIAKDKHVIVLGGGDTGSDCIGTSRRQGAKEITQIELLPMPPKERQAHNPWPLWPLVLKTSSSQEEGTNRAWSIMTKEFRGSNNAVESLRAVKLKWTKEEPNGRPNFEEIPGSEIDLKADLVLLAMGFIHTEHGPLVKDAGLELNSRGDIVVDPDYMTNVPGMFAAGDSALGASLVVRAIHQGREVAVGVNKYLQ